jgi:branched-chain amino acid aminotransferase
MMINSTAYTWLDGRFWRAKMQEEPYSFYPHLDVFENIPVYNGKAIKIKKHIERFFSVCASLALDISYTPAQIYFFCLDVIEKNKVNFGVIRVSSVINLSYSGCKIDVTPVDLHCNELTSVKLVVSPVRIKKNNFPHIFHHVARERAIKDGYDDALILDDRGNLTQTSSSNIFIVISDSIYTPKVELCVDGITRDLVIDIAKSEKIEVVESEIGLDLLNIADEIFLTNSIDQMRSVSIVDEHEFAKNNFTNFIYKKYLSYCLSDLQ